jgi:glycosyltransferase involved in cell wall biosynthesis
MKPKISVIIPTYNRGNLLIQALDSVFAQTYRPIELVVIDDGSTDTTEQQLSYWRDKISTDTGFVFIYHRQDNLGAPAARNKGIEISSGEYIQFFDSDDLLLPEKLNKQVSFMIENPEIDFVYSRAQIFNNIIGDTNLYVGNKKSMTLGGHAGAHPLKTDLGLYKRKVIETIGLWDESIKIWQEREYNLRLFTFGFKLAFVPEVLTYYRVHEEERISNNLNDIRYFHSLKKLKMTAESGLSSKSLNVFYQSLTSHYFSIVLSAVSENSISIYKKASRLAVIVSLKTNNYKLLMKSIFTYLLCRCLPKAIRIKTFKMIKEYIS